MPNTLNVAVQGCSHGQLKQIYKEIQNMESVENVKIDLLLCCGDFQSVRDQADLDSMAVPEKHRKMCDFVDYYTGKERAYVPTIFIAGNHESCRYLYELPFGGYVAPDIYYMGFCGSVIVNDEIRICGVSGIFKHYNYNYNHFECGTFDETTKRSFYHTRSIDIFKLSLLEGLKVDIFLSHDWPSTVYCRMNNDKNVSVDFDQNSLDQLLKYKPYFKEEMQRNVLGDQNKFELLKLLQPRYWFSAHLHTYFKSFISFVNDKKNDNDNEKFCCEFTALDKCLPEKQHLTFVKIDLKGEKKFDRVCINYDPTWLAIIKNTFHLDQLYQSRTMVANRENSFLNIRNGNLSEPLKPTHEQSNYFYSLLSQNNIDCIPKTYTSGFQQTNYLSVMLFGRDFFSVPTYKNADQII